MYNKLIPFFSEVKKISDRKIAWEKWDVNVIEQEIVENFYEENYDEEDSEVAEDALLFLEKIPHLVTTPMGMYQLHDKMNVMNQFECWMGYTNFDITHSIRDKIEEVILATSATVEGQTTAYYIEDSLKDTKVKILLFTLLVVLLQEMQNNNIKINILFIIIPLFNSWDNISN